jgi:hypothetical protein
MQRELERRERKGLRQAGLLAAACFAVVAVLIAFLSF